MDNDAKVKELLRAATAGAAYDEGTAGIVAVAIEFCRETDRILRKQHKSAAAERRDGFMEFVACAYHFMKVMGTDRDVLDKVARYHAVLGDIDRGVIGDLIAVNNGNPGVTSQIQLLRGMAAVALDYLKEAGDPLDKAAKRVARIPGYEKLLSGRSIGINAKTGEVPEPFRAVRKWRKNAIRGKDSAGNDLDETFREVWAIRQPPGSVTALEFRKLSEAQIRKLQHELGS